MTQFTEAPDVAGFLKKVSGLDNPQAEGNARLKEIVHKIVSDLYDTIDRFDVSEDEFHQRKRS